MKVRITHTVDVDPEAWAQEYGVEREDAAVRADVRIYFTGLIEDQLDVIGLRPER